MAELPRNYKALQSAKCPADRARVKHRLMGIPHLWFYVEASGRKSWYVRYEVGGPSGRKQREQRLGSFPDLSLAEARRLKEEAMALVSRDRDPWLEKRQARTAAPATTLEEVFELWLTQYSRPNKKTWDQDQARYKRLLRQPLGSRPIKEIDRAEIAERLAHIQSYSPSQAHHALVLLNTVFNWALQTGRVNGNPAHMQPFRRTPPRKTRYFNDKELGKFWKALEASGTSPGAKLALQLLLLTGQRVSDWVGARRNELCSEDDNVIPERGRLLVIPGDRYKGRKGKTPDHVVPLVSWTSELANEALRLGSRVVPGTPYLFPQGGGVRTLRRKFSGPLKSSSVSEAMARVCISAGMERATAHALRHTFVTQMGRLGQREAVDLVVGHKRRSITDRYDHFDYLAEKRDALKFWARHVKSVIESS